MKKYLVVLVHCWVNDLPYNFQGYKGVIFLIFVVAVCIIAPLVWCHVCNKTEPRNVYFQPMPPQTIQPNNCQQWIPQAYQPGTGSGINIVHTRASNDFLSISVLIILPLNQLFQTNILIR